MTLRSVLGFEKIPNGRQIQLLFGLAGGGKTSEIKRMQRTGDWPSHEIWR